MDNIRLSENQKKLLRSYATTKLVPPEAVPDDYEVLLHWELIEETDSDWYQRNTTERTPLYPRFQISDKGRAWLKQQEEKTA